MPSHEKEVTQAFEWRASTNESLFATSYGCTELVEWQRSRNSWEIDINFQEAARADADRTDSSQSDVVTVDMFRLAVEQFLENKRETVITENSLVPDAATLQQATQNSSCCAPVMPTMTKLQQVDAPDLRHENVVEDGEVANHFESIPTEFLLEIQTVLLDHGVDISNSLDVVNFDVEVLEHSLVLKGHRADLVRDFLTQWKKAIDNQIEQQRRIEVEIEEKKRAQQPRWRCAICGRAGCQVAPYIEGYDTIEY